MAKSSLVCEVHEENFESSTGDRSQVPEVKVRARDYSFVIIAYSKESGEVIDIKRYRQTVESKSNYLKQLKNQKGY